MDECLILSYTRIVLDEIWHRAIFSSGISIVDYLTQAKPLSEVTKKEKKKRKKYLYRKEYLYRSFFIDG